MANATPDLETFSTTRASFWNALLTSAISVLSTLVLVGVFFGGVFQRLATVEVKAEKNEQKIEAQNKETNLRLEEIKIRMVDKEDFKELRKDFQDFARIK